VFSFELYRCVVLCEMDACQCNLYKIDRVDLRKFAARGR